MKINLTTKEIIALLDGDHMAYDDGYGKPTKIYSEKTMTQKEFDKSEEKAVKKLKKAINYIHGSQMGE